MTYKTLYSADNDHGCFMWFYITISTGAGFSQRTAKSPLIVLKVMVLVPAEQPTFSTEMIDPRQWIAGHAC